MLESDQMALRGLRALRPAKYMKPPFHTYLNHAFVVWPVTAVLTIAQVPTEKTKIVNSAKLVDHDYHHRSLPRHSRTRL